MIKTVCPPLICFYFQVHQPYRLSDLRITDLGDKELDYFDNQTNKDIFRKVAEKCYLPANKMMLDILNQHQEFRIAFSLSGVFLEQCEQYGPEVLKSFQALVDTGRVELLAETYYHSLSSVMSLSEFCEQVEMHTDKIEQLFGVKPKVFRNTELIYSNNIAEVARQLGFKGILAEGVDHLLEGRTPNQPFITPSVILPEDDQKIINEYRHFKNPEERMHVLLKNYRLSDDVAFRFSDKSWIGFPLTVERFTDWILEGGGHSVNLFMDYETFGEHQWADTGIFKFLSDLPDHWKKSGIKTATPSEVLIAWETQHHEQYNVDGLISWADMERDLSAWRGNDIQDAALSGLYELESAVKQSTDKKLLNDWRKLQTSDHFYYMCTKFWSDGDVHKYFSPYNSPYEAYRRFSHALWNLKERLNKIQNSELKIQNDFDSNL